MASVATLAAVVIAAAGAVALRADDGGRGSQPMMGFGAPSDRNTERSSGDWGYGWAGGRMMDTGVAKDEFSYLVHMVAHHEEAVAAARQLERSERPQMRTFGRDVVAVQSAQIDRMRKWLATWYPGRSTDVDYEPMMRDLSGLAGDRLDRAFLEDMTVHHMSAVMMSQQLLARGSVDHPQIETLARSIRDAQHAEILQMRRWLSTWYGAG